MLGTTVRTEPAELYVTAARFGNDLSASELEQSRGFALIVNESLDIWITGRPVGFTSHW